MTSTRVAGRPAAPGDPLIEARRNGLRCLAVAMDRVRNRCSDREIAAAVRLAVEFEAEAAGIEIDRQEACA